MSRIQTDVAFCIRACVLSNYFDSNQFTITEKKSVCQFQESFKII